MSCRRSTLVWETHLHMCKCPHTANRGAHTSPGSRPWRGSCEGGGGIGEAAVRFSKLPASHSAKISNFGCTDRKVECTHVSHVIMLGHLGRVWKLASGVEWRENLLSIKWKNIPRSTSASCRLLASNQLTKEVYRHLKGISRQLNQGTLPHECLPRKKQMLAFCVRNGMNNIVCAFLIDWNYQIINLCNFRYLSLDNLRVGKLFVKRCFWWGYQSFWQAPELQVCLLQVMHHYC